ncbi:hypothetical protein HZH66_006720 [Vespula vulgaris]|uniref:Uncharacterized protein n=1 Tax=Vespula vulgaris TaxID=7454 RepID=A0A834N918_VESVU|nr:hypothetical protein HZH66_006720 [Vespula vulgaris]
MCYCVYQRSNGQEEGAIVVSEVRSKSMYGDVDDDEDGGDDRNGSGGGLIIENPDIESSSIVVVDDPGGREVASMEIARK